MCACIHFLSPSLPPSLSISLSLFLNPSAHANAHTYKAAYLNMCKRALSLFLNPSVHMAAYLNMWKQGTTDARVPKVLAADAREHSDDESALSFLQAAVRLAPEVSPPSLPRLHYRLLTLCPAAY